MFIVRCRDIFQPKKIQLTWEIFVFGASNSKLWIFIFANKFFFFWILSFSISYMYDLEHIIWQQSDTNFISCQKAYTFTRLFSTDFVLLYIFRRGRWRFSLQSKAICKRVNSVISYDEISIITMSSRYSQAYSNIKSFCYSLIWSAGFKIKMILGNYFFLLFRIQR